MFEHCMRIRVFEVDDKENHVFEKIIIGRDIEMTDYLVDKTLSPLKNEAGLPMAGFHSPNKAHAFVSAVIKGNGLIDWYMNTKDGYKEKSVEISLGHLVNDEFTRFDYDREFISPYGDRTFRYSIDRFTFWYPHLKRTFFRVMFKSFQFKEAHSAGLLSVIRGDKDDYYPSKNYDKPVFTSRPLKEDCLTDESVVEYQGFSSSATISFSHNLSIRILYSWYAYMDFNVNSIPIGTKFTLKALKELTLDDEYGDAIEIIDVDGVKRRIEYKEHDLYWLHLDFYEDDISIHRLSFN